MEQLLCVLDPERSGASLSLLLEIFWMRRALIATVYNEAESIGRWWNCICMQTVRPDEILVIDGGSTDATWSIIQKYSRQSVVPMRVRQIKCNIARGRNLAIQMTEAEIIASSDAGSLPEPSWFGEITRPLLEMPEIDAVGGRSVKQLNADAQRLVAFIEGEDTEPTGSEDVYPSSRNIAFRRKAWSNVGGYPEWLTLTAEDALFNMNLRAIGCRFHYSRDAIVAWLGRPTPSAYLQMLSSYGFGAAEARLYGGCFLRRARNVFIPVGMLLSKHGARHLWFRYRADLASVWGWLKGFLCGNRPPKGWKRVNGVFLSPEAQATISRLTAP